MTRDSYADLDVSEVWRPAPLGLCGSALAHWVTVLSKAGGRCQCKGVDDCGKKHVCTHRHGQYADKERQFMSVLPDDTVMCGPCFGRFRRREKAAAAAAVETVNETARLW